jgi:hypothetical protein
VSYIAQVLKRNKTLKVLNLSDNKIDAAGLQTLAQALVGYRVDADQDIRVANSGLMIEIKQHARNVGSQPEPMLWAGSGRGGFRSWFASKRHELTLVWSGHRIEVRPRQQH